MIGSKNHICQDKLHQKHLDSEQMGVFRQFIFGTFPEHMRSDSSNETLTRW